MQPNTSTGLTPETLDRTVPSRSVPLSPLERECPKCGARSSVSNSECPACGVVFARYRPSETAQGLTVEPRLLELWNLVVADYQSTERHARFIDACSERKQLAFAAQRYGLVLEAIPEEEVAQLMRQRIVGLASHTFEIANVESGWKFRVPAFNLMVICLGTIVFLMGLFIPQMHGVSGIGGAMVLLAIGVRLLLSRGDWFLRH